MDFIYGMGVTSTIMVLNRDSDILTFKVIRPRIYLCHSTPQSDLEMHTFVSVVIYANAKVYRTALVD